jgi:hypothetical protein
MHQAIFEGRTPIRVMRVGEVCRVRFINLPGEITCTIGRSCTQVLYIVVDAEYARESINVKKCFVSPIRIKLVIQGHGYLIRQSI